MSSSHNKRGRSNADSKPITIHGKSRTHLHIIRKLFHALTGLGFAALYEYFLTRTETLIVYVAIFVFLVFGEILRMRYPDTINRLLIWLTQSLLRSYEKDHASGMAFFVAGMIFCVFFFPKNVAVLSILYLSIGDPAASTAGIKYGSKSIKFSNGKSLIGYLSGMLTCSVLTYLYFIRTCEQSATLIFVSFLGGFAGILNDVNSHHANTFDAYLITIEEY